MTRWMLLPVLVVTSCLHSSRTADEEPAPPPKVLRPPTATPRPPIAESWTALLQPGAERQIEQRLIDRGYLESPATDRPDPRTYAALRRFQRDEGLPATG